MVVYLVLLRLAFRLLLLGYVSLRRARSWLERALDEGRRAADDAGRMEMP